MLAKDGVIEDEKEAQRIWEEEYNNHMMFLEEVDDDLNKISLENYDEYDNDNNVNWGSVCSEGEGIEKDRGVRRKRIFSEDDEQINRDSNDNNKHNGSRSDNIFEMKNPFRFIDFNININDDNNNDEQCNMNDDNDNDYMKKHEYLVKKSESNRNVKSDSHRNNINNNNNTIFSDNDIEIISPHNNNKIQLEDLPSSPLREQQHLIYPENIPKDKELTQAYHDFLNTKNTNINKTNSNIVASSLDDDDDGNDNAKHNNNNNNISRSNNNISHPKQQFHRNSVFSDSDNMLYRSEENDNVIFTSTPHDNYDNDNMNINSNNNNIPRLSDLSSSSIGMNNYINTTLPNTNRPNNNSSSQRKPPTEHIHRTETQLINPIIEDEDFISSPFQPAVPQSDNNRTSSSKIINPSQSHTFRSEQRVTFPNYSNPVHNFTKNERYTNPNINQVSQMQIKDKQYSSFRDFIKKAEHKSHLSLITLSRRSMVSQTSLNPLPVFLLINDASNHPQVVQKELIETIQQFRSLPELMSPTPYEDAVALRLHNEENGNEFSLSIEQLRLINVDNELIQVLSLKNLNGDTKYFLKAYLKEYIDKAIKCKLTNETEDILDIHYHSEKLHKKELLKLIDASRLAECLTSYGITTSINEDDLYVDLVDLDGKKYSIYAKDIEKLIRNVKKGVTIQKRETFTIKDTAITKIKLNPFRLRPAYSLNKKIHNDITNNNENDTLYAKKNNTSYINESISDASSLYGMNASGFSSSTKENEVIPYLFINSETNSYFYITNIKTLTKEFVCRKNIMDYIGKTSHNNSAFIKGNPMYSIDELKLTLHNNNINNEYVALPSSCISGNIPQTSQFIHKHYLTSALNGLMNNKQIKQYLTVYNYMNIPITFDLPLALISLYQIAPSPYMKDKILHLDDLTYYETEHGKGTFELKSEKHNSQYNQQQCKELLEYMKVDDIYSYPLFVRKPLLRKLLYNKAFNTNIEIKDTDRKPRMISLLNIMIANTKNDVSGISGISLYKNDVIPDKFVYIDVIDKDNENFVHLTQKDKIKAANDILRKDKEVNRIRLVDNEGKVFTAKIEKRRLCVKKERKWVKVKDANTKKDIYIYLSVIKHLLDEDDESGNNMRNDVLDVVDYYCKKGKVRKKDVKNMIKDYLNKKVVTHKGNASTNDADNNNNDKTIAIKHKNN